MHRSSWSLCSRQLILPKPKWIRRSRRLPRKIQILWAVSTDSQWVAAIRSTVRMSIDRLNNQAIRTSNTNLTSHRNMEARHRSFLPIRKFRNSASRCRSRPTTRQAVPMATPGPPIVPAVLLHRKAHRQRKLASRDWSSKPSVQLILSMKWMIAWTIWKRRFSVPLRRRLLPRDWRVLSKSSARRVLSVRLLQLILWLRDRFQ